MARAQGSRAQMALAFETVYGTPPVGGFTRMPFASTSLGAEQPLLNSELLGYGRDPLAPVKDATTGLPLKKAGTVPPFAAYLESEKIENLENLSEDLALAAPRGLFLLSPLASAKASPKP